MNIIQDTIEFELTAEETVVNDTVKVIAQVDAIITSDESDDTLYSRVRSTLTQFIPSAKWQFSNISRSNDTAGVERLSLVASARIPETENRNLQNRARDASQKGLSISDYHVDEQIPASMVDAASKKLRLKILELAGDELKDVREAMGDDTWRIYNVNHLVDSTKGHRHVMEAASRSLAYGIGGAAGAGDDEPLGNAQKFSIRSRVTLARKLSA